MTGSISAESHKRSLLVLQLKTRRDILKLISLNFKDADEIRGKLGLSVVHTIYHLSVLENALLVERSENGYCLTKKAINYVEKVEWI